VTADTLAAGRAKCSERLTEGTCLSLRTENVYCRFRCWQRARNNSCKLQRNGMRTLRIQSRRIAQTARLEQQCADATFTTDALSNDTQQ